MRKLTITVSDETAYQSMAADRQREIEALEWSENLIADVSDEMRRNPQDPACGDHKQ